MFRFTQIAAASAFTLAAFAAQAQTTPSTTDQGANPAGKTAPDKAGETGKMTPGTTGAMDNAVGGTATSPQDVRKQSQGKPSAADGGSMNPDAKKASPGTVGATPGSDAPAPK